MVVTLVVGYLWLCTYIDVDVVPIGTPQVSCNVVTAVGPRPAVIKPKVHSKLNK
jgi:hypothetical protein